MHNTIVNHDGQVPWLAVPYTPIYSAAFAGAAVGAINRPQCSRMAKESWVLRKHDGNAVLF